MGEDALNDGRVLNRGDELHLPGAARRPASFAREPELKT